MVSNNKRKIKTDLDSWMNGEKYIAYFKLNGKMFKINENVDVFYAEIEGSRLKELSIDELFAVAANKLESPSAMLKYDRNGVIQHYLVSKKTV